MFAASRPLVLFVTSFLGGQGYGVRNAVTLVCARVCQVPSSEWLSEWPDSGQSSHRRDNWPRTVTACLVTASSLMVVPASNLGPHTHSLVCPPPIGERPTSGKLTHSLHRAHLSPLSHESCPLRDPC